MTNISECPLRAGVTVLTISPPSRGPLSQWGWEDRQQPGNQMTSSPGALRAMDSQIGVVAISRGLCVAGLLRAERSLWGDDI